ncbi:hypothetical protein BT69DRAFT_1350526, partial [Atractiella rhizophila]
MTPTHSLISAIIAEDFGPAAETVTRHLLNNTTAPHGPNVAESLAILLQNNVLRFSDDEERFDVEVEEVLWRLRWGEIGRWVEEWEAGQEGEFEVSFSSVLSHTLENGKLRISDILDTFCGTGTTPKEKKRRSAVKAQISTMLKERFLSVTSRLEHVSLTERQLALEKEETAKQTKGGGVMSAKKIETMRKEVVAMMEKEDYDNSVATGKKRKAKANGTGEKKAKRGRMDEDVIEGDDVDEQAFVRVSYSRFAALYRNELIVEMVTQRYNEQVATVMRAMLEIDDQKYADDISGSSKSGVITLRDLQAKFSKKDIKYLSSAFPSSSDLYGDICASATVSPNSTLTALCAILCGGGAEMTSSSNLNNSQFIVSTAGAIGQGGTEGYRVDYGKCCEMLRRSVVEGFVDKRWGWAAKRIVRLLLEGTGEKKLEEKHIAKLCFLAPKDARSIIGALSNAHLLELQEVPRSAQRDVSRTFFLWYISPNSMHQILLHSVHKSIYNLLIRKASESQIEPRPLIRSKLERTDMREQFPVLETRVDQVLNEREKQDWQYWEWIEESIDVAVQRLWRDAFCLSPAGC